MKMKTNKDGSTKKHQTDSMSDAKSEESYKNEIISTINSALKAKSADFRIGERLSK